MKTKNGWMLGLTISCLIFLGVAQSSAQFENSLFGEGGIGQLAQTPVPYNSLSAVSAPEGSTVRDRFDLLSEYFSDSNLVDKFLNDYKTTTLTSDNFISFQDFFNRYVQTHPDFLSGLEDAFQKYLVKTGQTAEEIIQDLSQLTEENADVFQNGLDKYVDEEISKLRQKMKLEINQLHIPFDEKEDLVDLVNDIDPSKSSTISDFKNAVDKIQPDDKLLKAAKEVLKTAIDGTSATSEEKTALKKPVDGTRLSEDNKKKLKDDIDNLNIPEEEKNKLKNLVDKFGISEDQAEKLKEMADQFKTLKKLRDQYKQLIDDTLKNQKKIRDLLAQTRALKANMAPGDKKEPKDENKGLLMLILILFLLMMLMGGGGGA